MEEHMGEPLCQPWFLSVVSESPKTHPNLFVYTRQNPRLLPPHARATYFKRAPAPLACQFGIRPPPPPLFTHHLLWVPLQGTNAFLAQRGETCKAPFESFECVFRNCVAKWKHGGAAKKCAFENEIDWHRRDWKSHSDAHYLPPQCSLSCENFWLVDNI